MTFQMSLLPRLFVGPCGMIRSGQIASKCVFSLNESAHTVLNHAHVSVLSLCAGVLKGAAVVCHGQPF